jgi:hypothetical protein
MLYHKVIILDVLSGFDRVYDSVKSTEYFGDSVSMSGSLAALQATVMGLEAGCLEPRNLMLVRWTFPGHPSFAPPWRVHRPILRS